MAKHCGIHVSPRPAHGWAVPPFIRMYSYEDKLSGLRTSFATKVYIIVGGPAECDAPSSGFLLPSHIASGRFSRLGTHVIPHHKNLRRPLTRSLSTPSI